MTQTSLFAVKLSHEEPFSGGTKDLRLIGYTETMAKYAVKREIDGPLLPLAEWIGHHLSRECGINTPEFDIVECLDGQLAFGSRWESTATQCSHEVAKRMSTIALHSEAISKILGLDFFLPNPDRHTGNFLFVERGPTAICLSMDFSLSSVRDGTPFGRHPMNPGRNTSVLLELILKKTLNKFSKSKFNESIDALKALDTTDMESILAGAPDLWFTSLGRNDILRWWDANKGARLIQVRK